MSDTAIPASAVESIGRMSPPAQQVAIEGFAKFGFDTSTLAGAFPPLVAGAPAGIANDHASLKAAIEAHGLDLADLGADSVEAELAAMRAELKSRGTPLIGETSAAAKAAPAPIAPAASTDAEGLARWRHVLDNSSLDRATVIAEAKKSGYDISVPTDVVAAATVASEAAKTEANLQTALAPVTNKSRIDYGDHANTIPDLAAFDARAKNTLAKVGCPDLLLAPLVLSLLDTQAQYPPDDPNITGFEEQAQEAAAQKIAFAEQGHLISISQDKALVKDAEAGIAAIKAANRTWHDEPYASKAFHSLAAYIQLAGLTRAMRLRK